MFCPFIKDDCRSECVFYDRFSKTGISKCRIEAAAINIEYLGDFVATRESELDELLQDHKCSDTAAK